MDNLDGFQKLVSTRWTFSISISIGLERRDPQAYIFSKILQFHRGRGYFKPPPPSHPSCMSAWVVLKVMKIYTRGAQLQFVQDIRI